MAALQWLEGEVLVQADDVRTLVLRHNTVRLLFSLPPGTALGAVHAADATFPPEQFAMLRDGGRLHAYYAAVERAVGRVRAAAGAEGGQVRALDLGTGAGAVLAQMAARCGADSVVACELHDGLADCARRCVAANGLSKAVTVVNRDAALLERGKDVPVQGCNLLVLDLFDAQLVGDGAMGILEAAKRKGALAPGYRAVPAAATVWAMGVELYTAEAGGGFDVACVNKYRWDRRAQRVRLADLPHRALTKPKKVFELAFDERGRGPRRNREAVLRLEALQTGYLNAIVVWFDLHLDEEATITSGPRGVLPGGRLSPALERLHDGETVVATAKVERLARPATAADDGAPARDFQAAAGFQGPRAGMVFGLGDRGLGYYTDVRPAATATLTEVKADRGLASLDEYRAALRASPLEPVGGGGAAGPEDGEPRERYWGQAAHYLERAVQVEAGQKLTVLAKRDGNDLRFTLKEGVGSWVGKAPWKIEWGGGASVESPHFQRVHYCELLVRDFLMRVRSKRFPPIEKDMRMMLANCGNLFLDPEFLQEV